MTTRLTFMEWILARNFAKKTVYFRQIGGALANKKWNFFAWAGRRSPEKMDVESPSAGLRANARCRSGSANRLGLPCGGFFQGVGFARQRIIWRRREILRQVTQVPPRRKRQAGLRILRLAAP